MNQHNAETLVHLQQDTKVAEEVLSLAHLTLAPLAAVSQPQREFGEDIRFNAIASVWKSIKADFRTVDMAQVVIRATNHHTDAAWWCQQEHYRFSTGFMPVLREDIKQEKGK